MTNRQINYQVNFQGNVSNIQTALNSLKSMLNNLITKPINFDDRDVIEAIGHVKQLQQQLEQAVNVNTGKLDISKFNQQLKQSGQSLRTYAQSLQRLGPEGEQAFLQLSRSILQAEVQYQRLGGLANSLWLT